MRLDVKAHADEALARRTVDALSRFLARRADADRIEVLSVHTAAVERAASRGLAARLVVWGDRAPLALARWAVGAGLRGVCVESCSAHRSWRRCGAKASASRPAP